jgi:signal transduction histidine kinase
MPKGFLSKKKFLPFVIGTSWIVQFVMAFIFISDFVVQAVSYTENYTVVSAEGSLAIIAVILFSLLLLLVIIATQLQFVFSVNKLLRLQFQYLLIGIILSAIWAIITNIFIPFLHIAEIRILGPMGLIFFIGLSLYSLTKERMFDPRRLVADLASIFGLGVVLFIIVFAVRWTQQHLLGFDFFDNQSLLIDVFITQVVAFILLIIVPPWRVFFLQLTNSRLLFVQDIVEMVEYIANDSRTVSEFESKIVKAINSRLKDTKSGFFKDKMSDQLPLKVYIRQEKKDVNLKAKFKKGDIIAHMFRDRIDNEDVYFMITASKERIFVKEELDKIEQMLEKMKAEYERLVVFQDIKRFNLELTHRVNVQTKKLRVAIKALREVSNKKDEFMMLASHQLRTPISIIRGLGTMIIDGDFGVVPEETQTPVKKIVKVSVDLADIVDEIFDALHVDRIKIMKEHKDLGEIVIATVDELQPLAAKNNVTLGFQFHPQNEKFMTMFDPEKVTQVVFNLLNNAISYSPNGKVTAHITRVPDQNIIRFEVIDNGIGIPKNKINDLFEKFSRLENAKLVRPNGTGIGLYLAKLYITGHGGKIFASSEGEGKGSIFTVELPIEEAPIEEQVTMAH